MKMRLILQKKLDITSAYAPSVVSNDINTPKEEKQIFYDALSECEKETLKHNMLIVMGDMSARVIEAMNKREKQVIGKHALKGSTTPNDLKEETTRGNRDRQRVLF